MGGGGGIIQAPAGEGIVLSLTEKAIIYTMAGGAAGATSSAICGGNVAQGALYGAGFSLASYLFLVPNFEVFGKSAESAWAATANRIFNSAVTGAAFGAAYEGMTGGNVLQGMAAGALGWAAGEAANMLIRHGTGFVGSGLKNPKCEKGVFIYGLEGVLPFSIGGAVIGDEWAMRNLPNPVGAGESGYVIDHEISHALGKQRIMGPS